MLQRPRKAGRMSLQNFLYHYWSANNTRAILYWIRKDITTSWVIMERASTQSTSSPISILCAKLPLSQSMSRFTSNPVVKYTIKIWYQFRRQFKPSTDPTLTAPVAKNHMFIPSTIDAAIYGQKVASPHCVIPILMTLLPLFNRWLRNLIFLGHTFNSDLDSTCDRCLRALCITYFGHVRNY